MRTTGTIFGVVLILLGVIWMLQGINILPGSFMTGQLQWALYGAICSGAGACIAVFSRRLKRPPPAS
ncbi:MAG TPA: hypothetical protein VE934_03300 [Polaromonas sp.]|uniref:hypothetical protein n=1 Tax=Polaromonas sp. TaxID=1869339 RepID=UPI002D39C5AE|nr:hypothetical protein [Polaromonas sp.]HYW55956.1 hypothetical protein [Polaromonas sp.]